MEDLQDDKWYVLKAMYNRAMVAQRLLASMSIESFVPMEKLDIKVKGKKVVTKLVPSIRNLIFVKTSLSRIKEIKAAHKYLWYLTCNHNGVVEPLVVPEDQMVSFMECVLRGLDDIEYIDHLAVDVKKGDRVRIISGPFKGLEAIFVKISGRRSRQLVVMIDGLVAVAIKCLNSKMIIEKI